MKIHLKVDSTENGFISAHIVIDGYSAGYVVLDSDDYATFGHVLNEGALHVSGTSAVVDGLPVGVGE